MIISTLNKEMDSCVTATTILTTLIKMKKAAYKFQEFKNQLINILNIR